MSESDRLLLDDLQQHIIDLEHERRALAIRVAETRELLSIVLQQLHDLYRKAQPRASYITLDVVPDVEIPRGMLTARDIPWGDE